ncbi:unnamed protein product [Paramecium sonneborni]|uniref:Dynein axonemal assembly factor 5 TPR repeats domain-containing protein n=1 Tax=Paramecium sonneborni TaxID=65129 RepID=A0A8S1NSY8_9CILI|nr:unnamed protein product [Paramecium sonneborni]
MLTEPNIDRSFVEDQIKLLQRDINCIIDQDRNLRKSGLAKLQDFFKIKQNAPERIYIFDAYALKNLLRVFEDSVERNREAAINIVLNYLSLHDQHYNTETLRLIVDTIINRLNQLPFSETSEEIRLSLIKLLHQIQVKHIEAYSNNLQRLAHMIGKALQDNFPEVKKDAAIFAAEISKKLPIGEYMGEAVKSLNFNMQHAHTKIRKATVDSIAPVLLSRTNGTFLEIVLNNLKNLSLDKSSDVRKGTLIAVSELLMHFSIQNLNSYENNLILILMNSLSDDSKEIQNLAMQLLDQIGLKRQKLDEEANL